MSQFLEVLESLDLEDDWERIRRKGELSAVLDKKLLPR